jgi:glucan phosphorylase
LFIINSLTTNPYTYQQNIKLYENLLSAIGSEWEACAKIKDISEKKLDRNYANKVLQKILNAIKNRTYSSLRDLYAAKEFYTSESKKLITSLKTHKSIIVSYL